MNDKLKHFVFRTAIPEILLHLLKNKDGEYTSTISHELNITYSHVSKMLKILGNNRLITIEREGRTKFINLTPKGIKIAKLIETILEVK